MIQKVAILGAESSGKSALAEALASHFNTLWVPEYLRDFVDQHQRVPRSDEQLHIAQTQRERELELAASAKEYLFCDTTPLMTALYSRHYFTDLDPELVRLEHLHDYAFTIVTAPDFPWTADGLQRESPAVRQRVHEELLDLLDSREIPFMLVEGPLANRIEQVEFALQFLN